MGVIPAYRFSDLAGDRLRGDISCQLAPWVLKEMGLPLHTAQFELYQSFSYYSDVLGGVYLTLLKDQISDLASIPKWLDALFMAGDDPRIALGAWLHDHIYGARGKIFVTRVLPPLTGPVPLIPMRVTRKIADQVLREAMVELLARKDQQFLVYQMLRRVGDGWKGDSWTERFTG